VSIARAFRNVVHPVQVLPPREAYRLWAPSYDDRAHNAVLFLEEMEILPLFDKLAFKDKSVIDLGCGTGRHMGHIRNRNPRRIVGVDFSNAMLSIARQRTDSSEACFIEANIEEMPLVDSLFDIGIASLVLSHVKDMKQALGEVSRILKPGATLLIADLHWTFDDHGWKRTFGPNQSVSSRYAVENNAHDLDEYYDAFHTNHFSVQSFVEPKIDSTLRPFFENAHMLKTFHRFEGSPLLVVFQLRRQ
jgi:malonyl-CoA O-methyltransferase